MLDQSFYTPSGNSALCFNGGLCTQCEHHKVVPHRECKWICIQLLWLDFAHKGHWTRVNKLCRCAGL